jgi:hypothetical protein
MKPFSFLAKVGLVAVLAIGLTACGKKKNGSSGGTVATTPNSTCTWNGSQWVISGTSTTCTPSTTTCPSNGQYTDSNGVVRSCTPGQSISNNYPPPNNNYPWNNGFQQGGCSQYEYQYGVPYVPVYMQGQYWCVRYDLLYGYGQNQNYYNYGYNYYYSYPPYQSNSCGNQIYLGGSFGGGSGYVGLCF